MIFLLIGLIITTIACIAYGALYDKDFKELESENNDLIDKKLNEIEEDKRDLYRIVEVEHSFKRNKESTPYIIQHRINGAWNDIAHFNYLKEAELILCNIIELKGVYREKVIKEIEIK